MAVWDQGGQVGVLRLKLRTATASRTLTRKGRAVEVPARNMETHRSEICKARSRSEAKLRPCVGRGQLVPEIPGAQSPRRPALTAGRAVSGDLVPGNPGTNRVGRGLLKSIRGKFARRPGARRHSGRLAVGSRPGNGPVPVPVSGPVWCWASPAFSPRSHS